MGRNAAREQMPRPAANKGLNFASDRNELAKNSPHLNLPGENSTQGHFDLALGNLEQTTLPDYSRLQSTKRSRCMRAVLSGHVRGNFLCSHETTNTDNNL